MNEVDVSLIIGTRNRADQLATCLQYVERQRPRYRWELLVVDNGSSDGTAELLTDFAARAAFPVTILSEPRPGKSRGLNLAWRRAAGAILAFVDDDCYVAPNYIDAAFKAFDDPRVGFAGGRIDLFDPADYPLTIRTDPEAELVKPRSFIRAGAFQGANMMFRREVLEAIGGFDPDFGAGAPFSGDDVDAQARASFAGWWGLYTPDVVVAHHHRRTDRDAPALKRRYALGRGAYITKYLLAAETRSVYLRGWYWSLRTALREPGERKREFVWEAQGAIGYLAHRLRHGGA